MRRYLKWKLMLKTLPIVAAVLAIDYIVDLKLKEGFVDFTDLGPILTAGAFLIGFMLAGTIADYKEAEKLPGEIACTLETIEESLAVASSKKDLDLPAAQTKLFAMISAVSDVLARRAKLADAYAAMNAFSAIAHEMDKTGAGSMATRTLGEMHNLRKAITRVDVIARTSFIDSGYALVDFIVFAVVVLMLVARFKTLLVEYVLIGFITLIYTYMINLIRDVDNPFDYDRDGYPKGAADVDPHLVYDYRDRARARLLGPQAGS